ncbi:ABC transporter substrate-binding protein [Sporosarcina siberiensis]|uniref:ABC transporter substrate-binding protein n=1 Tax=Sporosarcina siberiensis TaxID=1365606 RepID=A0ABW4SD90_9BACL
MMKNIKVLLFLLMAFLLVGCNDNTEKPEGSEKPESSDEETKSEIRVALGGQPSSLDPAVTPGAPTKYTARHIFESLLTVNSEYQPVPMLAESFEISEDGKTYSFILREKVKFHNGNEMKSEDVVASMNRWIELSPVAKSVFGDSKFESEGDYKVFIQLETISSEALDVLATPKQFAGIMPKEISDAAGPEGAKEYIGTGPFKFVEWKQDQYIHFTKFDDYQGLEEEASGLSGKKEALVTDLYFDIVADPSIHLAGLQTEIYDVSLSLPQDSYEQVKANSDMKTYLSLYGNLALVYNKAEGLFTDVNMRKAVNAAIDSEEAMLGALANKDLFELNHGYMNKFQKNWYSESGKESYNLADTEKAKEYLKKAGYNGEEVTLMTTRDYEYMYKTAVVTKEQLEKAGINVTLAVYDWPTLLEKENDAGSWDMLTIGFSTVTTPSQILYLTNNQHGYTDDKKIAELLKDIAVSTSVEESQKLFSDIQEYGWNEYLPVTDYGFYYDFFGSTSKVEGMTTFEGPVLWNTKVLK